MTRHRFGTAGFDEALRRFDPQVAGVIRLSAALCAEPGVTVPAHKADLAAVRRTVALAADRARALGLEVLSFDAGPDRPYPLLVAWSPGADPRAPDVHEAIVLIGHLDVVGADAAQWEPALDGAGLHARGATDMKTVVATFLEWMGARGPVPGGPARVVVLSGCEENGSAAPWSAEDALQWLEGDCGCRVRFAIVGERTGELEWMEPPPVVGPVCRENRSWRWVRAAVAGQGDEALARIVDAVRAGREAVAELNRTAVPADAAGRQPGLRSGWLCPFVWVPPAAGPQGTVIRLDRPAGASMHAAAADAAHPSAVERLSDAYGRLRAQASAVGAEVALVAVRIGEDGNFNTVDGSGRLWCAWSGPGASEAVVSVGDGLQAAVVGADDVPWGPAEASFGLDIRELLAHKDAIDARLAALEASPGSAVVRVNDRPAWRCPDAADLTALLDAWAEVVGAPSPDLVKLHGNDGGLVAARAGATGWAPVVVFGQVGVRPHGPDETHDCRSIRPYWNILDRFADRVWGG